MEPSDELVAFAKTWPIPDFPNPPGLTQVLVAFVQAAFDARLIVPADEHERVKAELAAVEKDRDEILESEGLD